MAHFYFTDLDFILISRALGLIGFAIYVVGFFFLSVGRLHSSQPIYFVMVLVASTCVLISLWADFNLAAALIQGFYMLMSTGGIIVRLKQRKAMSFA
ncbi:hypothetical protein Jann_1687 [Jannaschia sp. CCS1]|nr:hypothetical protein Jann_1687 [Jannaschia sp. CCS1]